MKRYLLFFILFFLRLHSAFSQNQELTRIPFILNNDHIIFQLSVNNSAPLNFMFDSGAGGILLNKQIADSIGLVSDSERINTGAVGTHRVAILKGISLQIGDLSVNNVTMMRDDAGFEELDDGQEVAGIIGFHLLSRYVIEVNYNTSELIFYNRSAFTYEGDGVVLPIVLSYNLPLTVCVVQVDNSTEFEGLFLVDTGARADLLFSSPTVDKYNMIDAIGDHYVLKTEVGSSGKKAKIMYGQVHKLQFAEHDFNQVPAVLSQAQAGVLSFDGIDGIVGNRILQRYNIIFDYQRSLLYLEPNSNMSNKYHLNVSGFNLYFKEGKPFIKNVIDHSPASRAGLRNGDEIISINGVVAQKMESEAIRDYFRTEGTKLKLVIKRGSKLKYTEIRLRSLI